MAHLGWTFALSGCLALGAAEGAPGAEQRPALATAWERRDALPSRPRCVAPAEAAWGRAPPAGARKRGRLLPSLREAPAPVRVLQPRSATGGLPR